MVRSKPRPEARSEPLLEVVRELVRTYQAFHLYDARRHRDNGLTTSQADVLFTLGNTEGMTSKELSERTLITKGTLTGVLDRLEARGLVERRTWDGDGRVIIVALTKAGDRLFQDQFPDHVRYLKQRLGRLDERERRSIVRALATLRSVF